MNSSNAEIFTGTYAKLSAINLEESFTQIIHSHAGNQVLYIEYVRFLQLSNLSQPTVRYYTSDVEQFLAWLEFPIDHKRMGTEVAESYSEYLQHVTHQSRPNNLARYSPNTIYRKFHSVRRFIDFLVNERVLPSNPFRDLRAQIPKQTSSTQRDTILSNDTIRLLISTCDVSTPIGIRDRALLSLIAGLGLRVGEIHQLDIDDIDFRDRSIIIKKTHVNNRQMPLVEHFLDTQSQWISVRAIYATSQDALFISLHHNSAKGEPGLRLSHRGIRSVVEKGLARIGVTDVGGGPSLLRRSSFHHLIASGANLGEIHSLFGITPKTIHAFQQYTGDVFHDKDRVGG